MTGQERRQQLLDIGRRLFAERGFDGTSIEEIAAQAGVSKPVVYEHFGGKEEFEVRDKSRNVNWLAILSFGESWHNLHHADPTCARHGVLKGQIDIAARLIWVAEKLGWVSDVRWPDEARLTGKQTGSSRKLGSMTKRAVTRTIG